MGPRREGLPYAPKNDIEAVFGPGNDQISERAENLALSMSSNMGRAVPEGLKRIAKYGKNVYDPKTNTLAGWWTGPRNAYQKSEYLPDSEMSNLFEQTQDDFTREGMPWLREMTARPQTAVDFANHHPIYGGGSLGMGIKQGLDQTTNLDGGAAWKRASEAARFLEDPEYRYLQPAQLRPWSQSQRTDLATVLEKDIGVPQHAETVREGLVHNNPATLHRSQVMNFDPESVVDLSVRWDQQSKPVKEMIFDRFLTQPDMLPSNRQGVMPMLKSPIGRWADPEHFASMSKRGRWQEIMQEQMPNSMFIDQTRFGPRIMGSIDGPEMWNTQTIPDVKAKQITNVKDYDFDWLVPMFERFYGKDWR
jgi:hypothetical protein